MGKVKFKPIAEEFPHLMHLWHKHKNEEIGLDPFKVTPGSDKKFWAIFDCQHEKLVRIKSVFLEGKRCGEKQCRMNSTIQTNVKKYGKKFYFQHQDFKQKFEKSMISKYGKKYNMQIELFRNKRKVTNILKYGVENPMQNDSISAKSRAKSYETKTIQIAGHEFYYQGYEHFKLKELILKDKIDPSDITTSCSGIPMHGFSYEYQGKDHKYTPDLYIKSLKKFIEVKSPWTYDRGDTELKKESPEGLNMKLQNYSKLLAVVSAGYTVELVVYDKNGICLLREIYQDS